LAISAGRLRERRDRGSVLMTLRTMGPCLGRAARRLGLAGCPEELEECRSVRGFVVPSHHRLVPECTKLTLSSFLPSYVQGSSPSQVPSPNKRPRSESKSPNTSPTLSNAAVQVLLPSSTNHLSPAGNLPRASSPLRTSFTLPMPGAPHVYSRSQLGTELVMGAQPSGVSPVGVSPVGTPMEGMVAGPIGS
jgi:hypothetical protein